ncbi:MAG: DUF3750 domain-containing protein [Pseudomonadales bacterium]|jgi:hypothetical protein|nr:DUF3750 domain-containing protein [Pseudomonadales bacterium]
MTLTMRRRAAFGAGVLILALVLSACASDGWRTARRDSAGIAPRPETFEEAVVQVYAAAVYGWRGVVADHTWVAVKPRGASTYHRFEVLGWRARRGRPVVVESDGLPDRFWYGSEPRLLVDLRGAEAEALIPRIEAASSCYPFPDSYTLYPGPNSNSYIQWIALEVPELDLALPWRAIGKNWMREHYEEVSGSC